MSVASRGRDVDPVRYPHLRRMQECVDAMEAQVEVMQESIPFHLITWHRAKREWKKLEREWKREREFALKEVYGA